MWLTTQTQLFTCYVCIKMNGCGGVTLIADKLEHVQTFTKKIQQCIKILCHIYMKLNMSTVVFVLLWKHMSGWELECSDTHGDWSVLIHMVTGVFWYTWWLECSHTHGDWSVLIHMVTGVFWYTWWLLDSGFPRSFWGFLWYCFQLGHGSFLSHSLTH
jgi:hypothetical protein